MKDLDRRVAVAPMMDWTDDLKKCGWINHLGVLEKSRRLYVTSARELEIACSGPS
jgi:hypothetical protein